MQRFLNECLRDPALGIVVAIALIIAMVMAWFVLKDQLVKRQKRQLRQRRRRETRDGEAGKKNSAPVPR